MILENQDVAKPFVVLEIEHAVAVSPENVLDGALRQGSQSRGVIGRFHDNLVRADAIHLVKEAFTFAVEIALDAECGEFIGHDANGPSGGVRASVAAAVDENLRRRLDFMAGAEWAILAVWQRRDALAQKIVWALSALGGNDYPTASNRIFSQLRQSNPPRQGQKLGRRARLLGLRLYRVWRC